MCNIFLKDGLIHVVTLLVCVFLPSPFVKSACNLHLTGRNKTCRNVADEQKVLFAVLARLEYRWQSPVEAMMFCFRMD